MTPQEYCQKTVAKSGSSFYYSFLSLKEQKRDAIIALYAYCRAVDDVVDASAEAHIKKAKLDWWREEVNNLFQNTPQHPITKALLPVIEHYDLAQEYFLEILDGMEMDITIQRYASFKDLTLYCYRVASVVGLLSVGIFGYTDKNTLKYAHNLGLAFQLTNILRDIHEDIQHDRVYIPQDELKRFNVDESALRNAEYSDGFYELMKFQVERANQYYQQAFDLLPETDRHTQRAGLIMAAIYRALLDKITQRNYQVLSERISLTPIRKLWIAWITQRRENAKHKMWLKQSKHG